MKNVSNKKIIRTLSFRTMQEKKWKNLNAISAIALTTLLFTALFTVGSSMIESMQEGTFRQIGTAAHGGYKYLAMEEYERIKAAGGYEDISYSIIAGFASDPELNSLQTEVRYSEDKDAKWSYCYPEKGRMPEEKNECAASSKVLEALGVPPQIGAKVPITITTHDKDGNEKTLEEEFVLSGFWYSNDASHAEEFWISRKWLEENIDLLEENYNKRMDEKGLYHADGTLMASIWFDSSYDIESQMSSLSARAGFGENEVRESVNWGYATATVDGMTLALGIGLLGIIILSGYLIIYNIFYINVSSDIRYYGLLKTIGTTGKQLRRMVRGQALLLSAVGIPVGLLAGWFVGKQVLPFIYSAITISVKNVALNPWIFAGSALFSLLVVYLSCIKPCRLAAKVSPIEAVRYVESKQYKKKQKKTARISAPRLAAANMGRNKRKAAVVVASLSLSLILLNGTYCLVKGFSFDKYVETYLLSDMQISHYSAVNLAAAETDYEAVTEEAVGEIEAISGVESVSTLQCRLGLVSLSGEMTEKCAAYWSPEKMEEKGFFMEEIVAEIIDSRQTIGCSYCIPEDMMSYLTLLEGDLDLEKFKQGGYVLILPQGGDNWISEGDKITLGSYGDEPSPSKELEIMAVADFPYAISTKSYALGGISLLLTEKDFEELYDTRGGIHGCIDVAEGADSQVAAQIEALLEEKYPELVLITKDSLREEFSTENRMFSVIGGLLSFILALIGVLNLINAMITSILARKQEFAMMQAVGMTGKQLEKMLTMEGVWYGVWTLLISLTLGNVISYGLIYMMGKNMAFFEWNFHILPMVVSIPIIALVSIILPIICYHALCKKSIIERLRLAEM